MPSRWSTLCERPLVEGSPSAVESGGLRIQCPPDQSLLSLQCRGKSFSYIHLWTRFLSALAGLLYASAIVAHDRHPEYLLQATPWFLISLGRAALDLAVSTQASWLWRLDCLATSGLVLPPTCHALFRSCWVACWPSSPVNDLSPETGGHHCSDLDIQELSQFKDNPLLP